MIGLIIAGFFLSLILATTLFLNLYPSFGGSHSEVKIKTFEQSGNYKNKNFVNLIPTSLNMNFGKFVSVLRDYISGIPDQVPENPLPVLPLDSMTIASKSDSLVRITWFGHSAFLLEINEKKILVDPMFGDVPGPHPWLGPRRFSNGIPIAIEKLPQIDLVLFSHDHYDHLDYESVLKLKHKVKNFYVPLGVGSHLEAWGVESHKISELNWWDEIKSDELQFVCTPARHFSGRGILDRNTTLWASWVIRSDRFAIYFSGDSGYGPHFKDIGEKYGPFNFAMLECGQYDERWESVHMMPEQTAQASLDLNAEFMMPIHWGAFVLALHSWKDPVERLTNKAQALNVKVITPKIGQQFLINEPEIDDNNWWVRWN